MLSINAITKNKVLFVKTSCQTFIFMPTWPRKKVYLYASTIYRTPQKGGDEGRSKASACGENRFSERYYRHGLLTTSRRYVEVIDCVSRVERGGSLLAMTRTPCYYANQTGSPLQASSHKDTVFPRQFCRMYRFDKISDRCTECVTTDFSENV